MAIANNAKKIKASFEAGKIGYKFIESLRRGRYKLVTTIGDLIDNSDDANATKIQIMTTGPSKEITSIIIADDGSGMNKDKLYGSYTLGFERNRKSTEIGKFGLGGTLGSLNIAAHKLTVTRDASGVLLARQYDINQVRINDQWGTSEVQVTPEMTDMFNETLGTKSTGTIIVLSKFDLENFSTRRDNIERNIEKYCSQVYCEKIINSKLQITINGNVVPSIDPLCWYNKNTIKEVDEIIPGTNSRIRVVDLTNVPVAAAKQFDKNQGGYVFRCDRVIKSRICNNDDWSKTWQKHPNYRYCRWAVYFDADDDKYFGVTFDKSDISITQSMQDKIQEIVMSKARQIHNKTSIMSTDVDTEKHLDTMAKLAEGLQNTPSLEIDVETNDKGEIEIGEVIKLPTTNLPELKIPSYIVQEISLGQLSEPFKLNANPNKEESRYILSLNTDHRYISKFWLQSSVETKNAVTGWLLPYALSIFIQPDSADGCDLVDFRDSFNRKLIKATSKIDRS